MPYTIRPTTDFTKNLQKLDKSVSVRVFKFLDELSTLENPRDRGHSLKHENYGLWRYRLGDYRVLCEINDEQKTIYIISLGHRSTVYK